MLIVLAIFLIFGPEKIPSLARNLGKYINEIKRASDDIKLEINKEADRQDREKKLAEYKSKIQSDLEPEKTEKREVSSIQEKTETEKKEEKQETENSPEIQ
jgi:sec-independent protein translocase protein TatB